MEGLLEGWAEGTGLALRSAAVRLCCFCECASVAAMVGVPLLPLQLAVDVWTLADRRALMAEAGVEIWLQTLAATMMDGVASWEVTREMAVSGMLVLS